MYSCCFDRVFLFVYFMLITFELFVRIFCAKKSNPIWITKAEQHHHKNTHMKYSHPYVNGMDRFIYYEKRSIKNYCCESNIVRWKSLPWHHVDEKHNEIKSILHIAFIVRIRNCTSSKVEKTIRCVRAAF